MENVAAIYIIHSHFLSGIGRAHEPSQVHGEFISSTRFLLINMNYSVPFLFIFAYAGVITPAEDSYARHLLVASMVSDE